MDDPRNPALGHADARLALGVDVAVSPQLAELRRKLDRPSVANDETAPDGLEGLPYSGDFLVGVRHHDQMVVGDAVRIGPDAEVFRHQQVAALQRPRRSSEW